MEKEPKTTQLSKLEHIATEIAKGLASDPNLGTAKLARMADDAVTVAREIIRLCEEPKQEGP